VARFIDDSGAIQHVCIGLSRIDRSLDGAQLKGFVQLHLDDAGISKSQLMSAVTDSAAVNMSMAKHFNWEVRGFQEHARFANSFPIHHCFSHMITNGGTKWRECMRDSTQILSGLKGLRVSDSAKALFREITGTVLPDGTENRWFYWVDFVKAVLPHWGALPGFVRRCKDAGYMPKKVAKMNCGKARSSLVGTIPFDGLRGQGLQRERAGGSDRATARVPLGGSSVCADSHSSAPS
jgi:hypothetical protein